MTKEEQGNNKDFDSRLDLSSLNESTAKLKGEIASVVVGQDKAIDLILTAILANGHVLVEGVPGIAKTLISKLVAHALDVDFSRIQFTPDLMPSDILGTSVFNMKDASFEFRKGPIFSQLILIDEINRAPAKTQAALFEVMEERQVTMDGTTYDMKEPFMVMATQNPIEQEGTYRLPEAQLDRFLFKILMDYPQAEQEVEILKSHHERGSKSAFEGVQKILDSNHVIAYRDQAAKVHLEEALMNYIIEIIQKTRQDPSIYLGASPRAAVYLMNASKAYAALQGRDFVTPDDILFCAVPVLHHRVLLTPEREMEGETPQDVIKRITDETEVPR